MEKLIFDNQNRSWALTESAREAGLDPLEKNLVFLEMFKAGDFFYLLVDSKTGQVNQCSSAISEFLGMSKVAVTREEIAERIHPEDREAVAAFVEKSDRYLFSLSPRERFGLKTQYNFRLKTKYGRYKHVLFQQRLYRQYEDGGEEHLCIFSDVDDLKSDLTQKMSIVDIGFNKRFELLQWPCTKKRALNFTNRQREVLRLLSKGADIQGIADSMCISTATVRNHIFHIRRLTGAKSIAHLSALAFENKWIETP